MRLEYFQMLDRFVDVKADERWIKTESKVPMESPVFEGHFPGYALMPGVLLIENMAQTCGWLVSAITGFTGLPVLAGVKNAKIRGAVFPGMEIQTEGKIVHDGSGFAIADGKIMAGDTPINFLLKLPLPIGLVYREDGQIILDPDQHVQQAVQLVFIPIRVLVYNLRHRHSPH
jgi:3-hydroxyacyl-[acyl-carrier-protein] dehydratase